MALPRDVNIDKVELLRGLQGKLCERHGTRGAINLASLALAKELSGEMNLSTGSRKAISVRG